jgi:surface polysaccharide O-acyltransferase-like enzyme
VSARLPATRGHLDQVDLFRVLTFAAVVAVHSAAYTNPSDSVSAGGVAVVLHFTREAFFFLTGFVLVHAQGSKPLNTPALIRRSWARRLRLVGVPYLAWSVLYWAYHQIRDPESLHWAVSDLVWGILGGHAEYHLYFLVVSLQIYLAFPLLLALVRAGRRHPLALAAVLLAYEVLVMWWLHDATHPVGWQGWWAGKAFLLLPTYLFWVVLGGLAAQHLEPAQTWLVTHAKGVTVAGVLAVLLSEGWYQLVVARGASALDTDASAVLQPVMVLDSLGVIALLAVVSCRWGVASADHARTHRALLWCSSASFGVYLIHPLVLDGVLALGLNGPDPSLVQQPAATLLAWVLTLLGSAAAVEVLRRTPLSLPLTGRARPRRAPEQAGTQVPVAPLAGAGAG